MNLMWIQSTMATLQTAPVTVFRAPRQFNIPNPQKAGETMTVTKHMLHLMLDGRYLDALLPSPISGLLAPIQPAPAPALAAGQGDEDDAPDEGEYEDEPPAGRTYGDGLEIPAGMDKSIKAFDAYAEAHGHAPESYETLKAWAASLSDHGNGNGGTKAAPDAQAAMPLDDPAAQAAAVATARGELD